MQRKPNLPELLRSSWRTDAADLWFAIKAQPWLATTVFGFGFAAGLLAIALPALIIIAVQS